MNLKLKNLYVTEADITIEQRNFLKIFYSKKGSEP
jgi:hypothetical protein